MTPHEEADKLLELTQGDVLRALGVIESQLNTIYNRAQVFMTLAGAVITVTGFSGRRIAETGSLAQFLIVSGLLLVLGSAVWIYARAMSIKWVSSELDVAPREALAIIITRRQTKSRAYRTGGFVLCAGLALYCAALCLMLLAQK